MGPEGTNLQPLKNHRRFKLDRVLVQQIRKAIGAFSKIVNRSEGESVKKSEGCQTYGIHKLHTSYGVIVWGQGGG